MYMGCLLTILNQQFIEMLSSLLFLNPAPVVGFLTVLEGRIHVHRSRSWIGE